MIPFYDLAAVHARRATRVSESMQRVVESGWYVLGRELEQFEARFATWCSRTSCIGVNSGLDAVELALRALQLPRGSEVIVPSHTFFATWLAVLRADLVPRVVDVDPKSWVLSPSNVRLAIRDETRAILHVPLYGCPCDIDDLLAIAADANLYVVGDHAQAHGTQYAGRPLAALDDIAAFSFYPTKTLGALGDGGAVVVDREPWASTIRALRSYGSTTKNVHDIPGCNSRLDEVQAAVLNAKMDWIDEEISERRTIMSLYRDRLRRYDDAIAFQTIPEKAEPAWHLIVCRTNERDALMNWLAERGVQTMVHYPTPCHEQGAANGIQFETESVHNATALSRELVSLPMWPGMPYDQVERVCEYIGQFFDQR